MSTFIILDLDNTISNDEWRIERIEWQHRDPERRYHNYHILSGFDAAGNLPIWQDTPHNIVISTARPNAYRALTEEWLKRHYVRYRHLFMRNNGDHRSSTALKGMHLHWLMNLYEVPKEAIAHAYDDREDVCAMYRAQGIAASCLPLHSTCAYTDPGITL